MTSCVMARGGMACLRFSFFFRRQFFVRRAFETLNAETKPEHSGFRRAVARLFEVYRDEHGVAEGSLAEHVYSDGYFTALRPGRLGRPAEVILRGGALLPFGTANRVGHVDTPIDSPVPPVHRSHHFTGSARWPRPQVL